jgi:hypothetical protein
MQTVYSFDIKWRNGIRYLNNYRNKVLITFKKHMKFQINDEITLALNEMFSKQTCIDKNQN